MQIEVFESVKIGPRGKQRWHWHFRNKGRITADSEAFPKKANAIRAAKAVVERCIEPLWARAIVPASFPDFTKPAWDEKRQAFVIKWR